MALSPAVIKVIEKYDAGDFGPHFEDKTIRAFRAALLSNDCPVYKIEGVIEDSLASMDPF